MVMVLLLLNFAGTVDVVGVERTRGISSRLSHLENILVFGVNWLGGDRTDFLNPEKRKTCA